MDLIQSYVDPENELEQNLLAEQELYIQNIQRSQNHLMLYIQISKSNKII